MHRTIADLTNDIERWSYNTAVAHCMELLNLLQRYGRDEAHPERILPFYPAFLAGTRIASRGAVMERSILMLFSMLL